MSVFSTGMLWATYTVILICYLFKKSLQNDLTNSYKAVDSSKYVKVIFIFKDICVKYRYHKIKRKI